VTKNISARTTGICNFEMQDASLPVVRGGGGGQVPILREEV